VRQGRFRDDLYYRLNVVTLTLPPLRARPQDIPLLIDHFLRELASRHGRGPVAVDPEAQRRLLTYDWPGNIRELQNVLERAMLLAEQDVIGSEHLPPDVRAPHTSLAVPPAVAAADPAASSPLRSLDEVDREHVLRVLRAMRGNRDETSRVLGISRRTLSRMILRWSLPRRFE
jgi:DNA-binding NtrC family response regulator